MRRTRLIWTLFPTYLFVTIAALLAVTFYTSRTVRNFYIHQIDKDLDARVTLLLPQIESFLNPLDIEGMAAVVERTAKATGTRITIILPDGRVIVDSAERPERMENHATRPEVMQALAEGTGAAMRHSVTVNETMMYCAKLAGLPEAPAAVVRAAIPVTFINENLWSIYARIIGAGAIVATLAAGISWAVSKRIMRPLEDLKAAAERFADGNLSRPLPLLQSYEFSGLAEAMNRMAAQLDERIQTAIRQKNEQDAVLSSMVESVLAVDNAERIISVNPAGARLLGVDAKRVQGRPLREVVANDALREFVALALSSGQTVESEIVLEDKGEQTLQAHGTVLHDADGRSIGVLVVLNDVTRLRRLERVRRDFVANVSHELKTPITSIKGFVETLLDDERHLGEDSERFLRIVAKQADRLNAIIEDLLILSRIEQDEEAAEGFLQRNAVSSVIHAAVQLCSAAADAKDIKLNVSCDKKLKAHMNAQLFEQGLVNLIDNAIKYSDPGSTVHITAAREESGIIVRVRDEGCGIPPEHLPRLFERFYRVDKARSRNMGGTGLGLAIVKHIAQTHGGRVTVESKPGEGSVFSIHLPDRSAADEDAA
jgi:two-component system phosphate regulon sensor histidine kinase PhoR